MLDAIANKVRRFGQNLFISVMGDNSVIQYSFISFVFLVTLSICGYFVPSMLFYVFFILLLIFASLVMGVMITYVVEIYKDVSKK